VCSIAFAPVSVVELSLAPLCRDRKATGSYYTSDYSVKYIVEHTVGPVLDEKFKAIAPQLREAQAAHRKKVRDLGRGVARRDDHCPYCRTESTTGQSFLDSQG